MPYLNTLDTIIAMVVVLLVLSLIVQAIQSFIKKIFKMKSRTLLKSLEDLFENVITPSPTPPATGGKPAPQPAEALVQDVVDKFRLLGRETFWGRPMLDSLAKNDLLKVLTKVGADNLFPGYANKFQSLWTGLTTLRDEIQKIDQMQLAGEASAKFAAMQEALMPLVTDMGALLQGNQVRTDIIFGDLIRLRQIKVQEVISLLGEVQNKVEQDIAAAEAALAEARKAGGETEQAGEKVAALNQLAEGLKGIAARITELGGAIDAAFAPLRVKLNEVDTWYDTVMQSFEERYTRHMKTVAIILSLIVVGYLNANFFRIYRSISTNDIQRNMIVQQGEPLLAELQQGQTTAEAAPATTPAASPVQTPQATPAPSPAPGAAAPPPQASPTASPNPSPSAKTVQQAANDFKRTVKSYADTYESFGFSPLTLEQVEHWLKSVEGQTVQRNSAGEPVKLKLPAPNCQERDEQGNPALGADGKPVTCEPRWVPIPVGCQSEDGNGKPILDEGNNPVSCAPAWRRMTWSEWYASRRHDVYSLIGWGIMALLLSVGAPFWQDALESLFGIKNLLRKRSDTKNVEEERGGQPRS